MNARQPFAPDRCEFAAVVRRVGLVAPEKRASTQNRRRYRTTARFAEVTRRPAPSSYAGYGAVHAQGRRSVIIGRLKFAQPR